MNAKPNDATKAAAQNRARLDDALAKFKEAAARTAASMRVAEAARPKSHKGTGRVPAHARPTAKATPQVVVRPEVGTYRKPDGSKVRGNRAARRAAGQRGKA